MKKLISLVLALVLTASLMAPVMATGTTPKHTDKAKTLYQLGLFKGTGMNSDGTPIFDLDKGATRIQGLVMLIRLLGEEEAALACTAEHPFTDVPSWGEKYVAYAYERGYTNGVGNNAFGSNDNLLGKAYVTFVLRALGYNDAAGDFSYNNALTFGAELGLLESGTCEGALLRDDCALLSYNAMRTAMKDTDTKLAEKLVNDGALTLEQVWESEVLSEEFIIPIDIKNKVIYEKDILAAFPNAMDTNGVGASGNISLATINPRTMFFANYYVERYCYGEYSSLPTTPNNFKELRVAGGDGSSHSLITALDKDGYLVGYGVVNAYSKEDTFVMKSCYYGGKAVADEVKAKLKSIPSQTKQVNNDVLYVEKVKTIHPDGTTTEEVYARIDKDKLPAGFGEITHIATVFPNRETQYIYSHLVGIYGPESGQSKDLDISKPNNQFKIFLNENYDSSRGYYIYLMCGDDIVAYFKEPSEYRLVETVIDLREEG